MEQKESRVHLRGFASMDAEKQRELARKGGKRAHELGTAHTFTSEEARLAGKKGGLAVSRNRERMAEIGRLGGRRKQKLLAAQKAQEGLKDGPPELLPAS